MAVVKNSTAERDDEDLFVSPYSRKVGERLRAIRRQKRLSLQDVEANSTEEFKASVLGAYERGERAISVPRLERLARFYNVPVEQLLPRDGSMAGADLVDGHSSPRLVIDLVRLSQMAGHPFDMLGRFMRMVQVQRQDFNGRALAIRSSDTWAIAAMLDVPVDQLASRLDGLGLLHQV
jgi:transcriptional regulator with XRE-family HTH domain